MPGDIEVGSLTWVPEDQAGKNRHVKFSLHFPLNNCSCFAWEKKKKKNSQIGEAKTREGNVPSWRGEKSVTSTSSYWIVWGSFTPVSFVCFLRKEGLWLPLFFYVEKFQPPGAEWNSVKFSPTISLARDYFLTSRGKKGVIILDNWMFLQCYIPSGDAILLNKHKPCDLWESITSDIKA